jgi:hydrophobe/amphiphile efflux-1 (HAE1) family protein
MPHFFIRRPVFAWVVALFIVLAGVLAIPRLPVSQYPSVAPPSVSIFATYPGATPETLDESVVSLIERELSGVKKLLYFESSSDTSGAAQVTATFEPGTDPDLAQVDVQNRLKAIEARLPQAVRQIGLQVETTNPNFLLVVTLRSSDSKVSDVALSDYLARNVVDVLKRAPGVGRVQLFTSERAMRIWIDPVKLVSYRLTTADIARAIEQQNAQVSPGRIGDLPNLPDQQITATLTVKGQLASPAEFEQIVLRANADGSKLLLRDVARVEVGPQNFQASTRQNGTPTAGLGVQLAPGANALKTADEIKKRMADLARNFPAGLSYDIPYDTAPFVQISIEKVVVTLLEAMVLVFAVMLLFLQSVRYTLIPAIVVPIALLGTFAVMLAAGFSINILTMFGMVLAIGILVDDAIVVVENVERIMASEGLPPRQATEKAMREISGAVIGITLVLVAVFVPMALASGSVGAIYRQFTLSMAVSILISAFLALSLTPALCATLLKPASHAHAPRGPFAWFNRRFAQLTGRYTGWVERVLRRTGRMLVVYGAVVAALAFLFLRLPASFLPEEDQGYFLSIVQLPSDATQNRTLRVFEQLEQAVRARPSVQNVISVLGWGFTGAGQNVGIAFTNLKDWSQRKDGATAQSEAMLANMAMASLKDGMAMNVTPPSIPELGTAIGFNLRLEDRAHRGHAALLAAQGQLLAAAASSSVVAGVYPEGIDDGSSVRLQIDRQKANALGVAFADINHTVSAALGSSYINDFPNQGRLQQVVIQAEAAHRMQVDDVLKLHVRNERGDMVPIASFASATWEKGPMQLARYNGYPALRIAGSAAPGRSTGEAMAEMERLAASLPPGFAIEWTGQSYQERLSGAEAPGLLLLSMLVVFLVLAALYESWSIPFSVMLVVPLGVLGAVLAVTLRGMPNDVFFKVGLITIIGLSAKNAILIIEFARSLHAQGRSLTEAAIEAARLRFRPIVMTSLAFVLGVVPLVFARGASSATQNAIGTGVFGGMITATVLAVFLVPVFFVVVQRLVRRVP